MRCSVPSPFEVPRRRTPRGRRLGIDGFTSQEPAADRPTQTSATWTAPVPSPCYFYNFGHVNARSLTPRLDEINILLQEEQLDILCVSETWLRPDVLNRVLVFPGYVITRRDRTGLPHSRPPSRRRSGDPNQRGPQDN